jgi:hypothetical protein
LQEFTFSHILSGINAFNTFSLGQSLELKDSNYS